MFLSRLTCGIKVKSTGLTRKMKMKNTNVMTKITNHDSVNLCHRQFGWLLEFLSCSQEITEGTQMSSKNKEI